VKTRKIQPQDRAGLKTILNAQEPFKPEEIKVALELIDPALNHPIQEDCTIHIAVGNARNS